jgi:hypothetical protein
MSREATELDWSALAELAQIQSFDETVDESVRSLCSQLAQGQGRTPQLPLRGDEDAMLALLDLCELVESDRHMLHGASDAEAWLEAVHVHLRGEAETYILWFAHHGEM